MLKPINLTGEKFDCHVLSKYIDLTEGSPAAFHAEEATKAVLAKEAKDAEEVAICIRIDEFYIKNDEFVFK